jgi:hypothetical protein
MIYPHVVELSRGTANPAFPRSQRDLVMRSLRVKPVARTTRPVIDRDPRGIFR